MISWILAFKSQNPLIRTDKLVDPSFLICFFFFFFLLWVFFFFFKVPLESRSEVGVSVLLHTICLNS